MTISDELIKKYFTLATRTPLAEVENILRSHANPRDQKLVLAEHLTALYYGEKKAQEAKAAFIAQFSKGELPSDIPEKTVKPGTYLLSDLLLSTGLVASKSEARRMFDQNGVKVNQKPAQEQTLEIGKQNNLLLSVGKRQIKLVVRLRWFLHLRQLQCFPLGFLRSFRHRPCLRQPDFRRQRTCVLSP